MNMDIVGILAVFFAWFALQRWLLPRLGIPT